LNTNSSNDDLYRKVAKRVLTQSLALKKGEFLTVETWNNGLPFARHVVFEARKMGALPLTIFEDEDTYVEGVRATPKDMLGKMGKHEYKLLSATDAYVFIPGPVLGSYSHRLPREEVNASTAYGESWYKAAAKARLRGVRLAFGYIGGDAPSVLGRSVDAIVTHQLKAALADYSSIGKRASVLSSTFAAGSDVTLKTPGSKLTFRLTGVNEVDDGVVDAKDLESENNMCYIAPGYVYAEVDPTSVSGKFTFSPTVTRFGLIKDGTLEFKDGRVTGWSSKSSSATLGKLAAAASEQARQASSMMVGLNPLLSYGYGQNSHSAGVISFRAFGVNFTSGRGSLIVGGKTLVDRGRL
jgi:leucyl aminopeptidase (aminopeptidase T)